MTARNMLGTGERREALDILGAETLVELANGDTASLPKTPGGPLTVELGGASRFTES
jgi:hypothetical protein